MEHIKRRVKNKLFHDNRCKKLIASQKKRRRQKHTPYTAKSLNRISLHAPAQLSMFKSPAASLEFFEAVLDKIKNCKVNTTLFFDLSQVVFITPDAIMYLIAIINNTKKLRAFKIKCQGNMPNDLIARGIFPKVGFFDFMNSPYMHRIDNSNRYKKIQNGTKAEGHTAGAFCEFVHSSCSQSYIDTKQLYPMIIELMTNTYQHAYKSTGLSESPEMDSNWYLFAQDIGSAIHFVFLDTGIGIPRTVAKKFTENVTDLISSKNHDAKYLESALTGDFLRSETRKTYRGLGLPEIYEACKEDQINNLQIISGRAICTVSKDSTIIGETLSSEFRGTLFCWDVAK